jgi:hypothetical protein
MVSPRITIVALCALWAMCLLWGCVHGESYWPLFNMFFLALGALPPIFGSLTSHGLWGAIGDFSGGVVLCSLCAFPLVLKNAEIIPLGSVLIIWGGNACLVGAGFVATRL